MKGGAMPKADAATLERFQSLVPTDARVEVKPMFGHRAAFVNGNMFFGTFGDGLILRLDEASREELVEAGGEPFAPMGRPMREYVLLPAAWRDDVRGTRGWIARSLAWVSALPAKEPKRPAAAKGTKKGAGARARKSTASAKPAAARRRRT